MKLWIVAQCWAVVGALAIGACTTTDHGALAVREGRGGSGNGLDAGDLADSAFDSVDELDMADWDEGGTEPDGDAPETSIVPDGPSRITLINGLVDVQSVRVCFHARTKDGDLAPLSVFPIPESEAGLGFARSMDATSLLDEVDVSSQDIRVVAYSGHLSAVAGRKCDELDTRSGVRVMELPLIPAGTLSAGRSVLMVLAGCAWSTGEQGCGFGLGGQPTATLLMASMSRATTPNRIGFQAFGGSLAANPLWLRHVREGQISADLASNVAHGAIAPIPPTTAMWAADLGPTPEDNELNVHEAAVSAPVLSTLLPEALERGGISAGELMDGHNFTAVWVGAKEGLTTGTEETAAWHQFTLLVVRSDP